MEHRDPSTAPIPLRWVEDLINTRSLVYGWDDLGTAEDLARWLRERGLLDADAALQSADLTRAIRLREGLRTLLAGEPEPTEWPALANDLALVVAANNGTPTLTPRSTAPGKAALARILAVVAGAVADGTWQRMKACQNADCRWAYYDHSRNKSRAWCSMQTCGNQAKARAFRRRQ